MKKPSKAKSRKVSAKSKEEKSYVLTTFRLSKRAIAEADAIKDVLNLSTRTAAVQFALGQMFKELPNRSAYKLDEIRAILEKYVAELQ